MRAWEALGYSIVFGVAMLAVVSQLGLITPGPLIPGLEVGETRSKAPVATGDLKLHYIDVGQGDGVVWELPDGSLFIYDCGPAAADAASNPVVAYIRETLGRPVGARIEALIVSHGHLDHIGGCDEIFDTFEVARVYDTWYEGDDAPKSYQRFRDAVRAEGSVISSLSGAGRIGPGTQIGAADIEVEVLAPASPATRWDSIAEHSLVVRIGFAGWHACFQGDIETSQESKLAAAERDLTCDVYLVGHHGSRYASSEAWLAKMAPRVAVVSYGDNTYGHPTAEALCRVETAGARVHGTGESGTIVVTLRAGSLLVAPDTPLTSRCG